ncbi:glycosyltransferase family 4 protein [Oceanomicrobium pacificus]|uniref:Glycosyltransferase n=1 Tax=Oceanomicrobium pacificus TaxID=2692916 RepID=A0A6B0TPU3_9RHOB|nr:glycosyltransferase family 1 protein [Oceanomicrobium pacificus]MXU64689.1 glycosyltransferase [Oceanomicrobium pacificus]
MQGRLLDITRMANRADLRHATGIDRVELAYARHLSDGAAPACFLWRGPRRWALLDASGLAAMLAVQSGHMDMAPDLLGRIDRRLGRRTALRAAAESAVRRQALSLGPPDRVARQAGRRLGQGFEFLSVGHAPITAVAYARLRRAGAGRISTMVHDLIPLTHPEECRPGTAERFLRFLDPALAASDRIICNSCATRDALQRMRGASGLPDLTVAHLGTDLPPRAAAPDPGDRPLFVILSTIEPRKNHALLLDIWERFAATLPADALPHLHIVGRRGWRNEDLFARLDASPLVGQCIFEHGDLGDAALAQLLDRATALLMPSRAEGFGLPVAEARMRGLPVIASDLPALREVGGDAALYIPPAERDTWAAAILEAATADRGPDMAAGGSGDFTWAAHFEQVFGP